MTRAFWLCTTLVAYAFATAFIWSYEPATAAAKPTAQIDVTGITAQAKLLPHMQFEMN